MRDPLSPLLEDGVIDAVVARLKTGKEAELWLVRHRDELLAAKVYKERLARSFRNDAAYREGRRVRDTRTQRAMDRGSRFGRAAAEDAWKTREADALHALHAAGVRVPRPVTFHEGVLVMELVVDAQGHPAPRLVDAHLRREDAAPLYADLRAQAVRMLACDLVHGDLSPYNVLVGHAGPVVIDFPQVVGAAHNAQAEAFFRRDLENLRRFLAALDPALHAAAGDAREIWRAYVRRELTPDFVPSGRAEAPRDGGRRGAPRPPRHDRAGAPAPSGEPRREPHRGSGGPQGRPRRERPAQGPEVIRVARAPAHARHPAQPAHHGAPRAGPAQTNPAHARAAASEDAPRPSSRASHPPRATSGAPGHAPRSGEAGEGRRRRRRRR